MRSALTVVAAIGLLSCALASPADARRPPTKQERAAILRAAGNGCALYPPGSCRWVVRVSTARRGWAAVYIRPRRGQEGTVQPDVASLRRTRGRWRVHQRGNGGGCGVPASVRRDLDLACY
jgi:hypothetical protein